MCRALKVLCVAADRAALGEIKRAVVSAEWELCAGATSAEEAAAQLESERPHVLVIMGPFADVVAAARARWPWIRIVADRELPGVDAVAPAPEQLRVAVRGARVPRGPVRNEPAGPAGPGGQ